MTANHIQPVPIHYDLPQSIENYSQEIGRSGRDGKPALCEVLANRDNIHVLENFIYGDTPEKSSIHQLLKIIKENKGFVWEYLEIERCGNCSFCKNGKAVLPDTSALKPLSNFEFREITNIFSEAVGEQFSEVNLTKFLCGIYTPVFSKLKIKKLPYFGILENYHFMDVKKWINVQDQARGELECQARK